MKKNKISFPEPESDDAGWLVSYADMMTLIACFFILLMAFANFDPVGFSKKTKIVSKAFRKNKYKSSDLKLKNIEEEMAKHPEIKKMAKVTVEDGQLVMTLSGTVLFEKGSHTLNSKSQNLLEELVGIIKGQNINYKILAEGHTDHLDATYSKKYSNNWEVSSARAAIVISYFEKAGFAPRQLIAVGKADTMPLKENSDNLGNNIESNMLENRRVVIKVLEYRDPEKVKLGLGVYFPQEG